MNFNKGPGASTVVERRGPSFRKCGRHFRLSHGVTDCFTGPRELKQASDGMPRPILLRLGKGIDLFRSYLSHPAGEYIRLSFMAKLFSFPLCP